jgi:hypothetical protein
MASESSRVTFNRIEFIIIFLGPHLSHFQLIIPTPTTATTPATTIPHPTLT